MRGPQCKTHIKRLRFAPVAPRHFKQGADAGTHFAGTHPFQTLRHEDTVVVVEGDDIGDGAECDQIQKFAQIRFSKVV